MSSLIRSISGIRGIVGESLTPNVIVRHVSAFADLRGGTPIVVGFDGRPSGARIKEIVTGVLQMKGADVIDIGMAPTPTVQLAVELEHAAGGISITASHNPSQWNGLKFIDQSGVFLDAEQNTQLFSLADDELEKFVQWDALGSHELREDVLDLHIDAVMRIPGIDYDAIRERKFRVLVDAVNASGSVIVPRLLEKLGCEVLRYACEGHGLFPHTPEPIPKNLVEFGSQITELEVDLGVVVDPDADRLVLFTEKGEPYGEEYTITTAVASCAEAGILNEGMPVVVNLSTTRAVNDVAERIGAQVVRTPVGEINVVKRMLAINAPIGGEGSGGVVLPQVHAGRDSLVGIVLVLDAFARNGGSVSEYRSGLPNYHIRKETFPLEGLEFESVLAAITAKYPDNEQNTEDGIRIDFPKSWFHLRKSNTEPIVRAIIEAPTEEETGRLSQEISSAMFGEGN
ncbi:MAG: phosphoglucosamine mutase [Ectothiorhodospiraceae bacterium]|nr:phosphoglucosamine mutase [Ectothiorhodospiraceae bacterium]